jgi:hypothetical protein
LANRKPHTGTGIFRFAVKTLEDSKNLLLVLGIYADAIVLNRKYPLLSCCDAATLMRGGSALR